MEKMATIDMRMRERALTQQLEQATTEMKKLERENNDLKAQLSIKTQLLTGEVNPKDMPAIEAELQKEHEQLMRDREAEIAALKKQIHRLDTIVNELQHRQKKQQQGLLPILLRCSCAGGNDDLETEHAITVPE